MKDCRVLVIEDELLVGIDLVSVLETAGFGYVEHVVSEARAMLLLRNGRWDAVLADANLSGRNIERIARMLQERQIPFAVVTGYERASLPAIVGDAPMLGKPFTDTEVIAMARSLCRDGKTLAV